MKAEWEERPLGEVSTYLNRGLSPKYLEDGGICVLNQKCVRDHVVNFGPSRRHDATAKAVAPERIIQVGDVLVNSTGTGTLGRVAQLREAPPEPTTVDSHVTIVRPRKELFHSEFFGYMLVAIEEQLQAGGEGCGGQTELARAVLAERYRVRYPRSKDEQQRIVDILDEAFDGISKAKANAERNLENARAVFESAREDALAPRNGWRTGPLGDLCSIKHGFAFKGEFFTDAGEFVLLTPGSFFERGGYRERGEKTKYYIGEIPPEFLLNEGDMLTAMTEQAAGLLGSPLIVPESGKFLHNQRLGLFVPTPGQPWATKFFFHTMNLARVRKEIHDGGTGAKVRHTSPGRIQAVQVSYPATEKEQQLVADRLDEISAESERLERIYEQKLVALNELKTSLLHHAFAGAL
ncbi:restriction endonuclease subunit S [Myxococcus sp. AB025B]|uniref:restriction endonuclease subunit S n=1 Tax=Myxococcus sp. AB025B TaxID=2562794 RepID=UPI0011442D0F|nr:restriction endonuclease subunit S [Myxococcus sp. AB025B]